MNAIDKEIVMKALYEKAKVQALEEMRRKQDLEDAKRLNKINYLDFICDHPRLFLISVIPIGLLVTSIMESLLS